jgi:hypothetical protein
MSRPHIKTTHNLLFEACDWPRDKNIKLFRVGTCHGQWYSEELCYVILTVINNSPGNGHLQDVFEWFENSCKRDKKLLKVAEVMNQRFRKHLIEKRGFHPITMTEDLIKIC